MISFFNEDISFPPIKKRYLISWIKNCVKEENYSCGALSIIFCSDAYIHQINKQYLSHDYFTDIVTFNYSTEKFLQGDLFISTDRVLENSKVYNVDYFNELYRVVIHGVLHLIGYNDKTNNEKKLMTLKEDFYLAKLP